MSHFCVMVVGDDIEKQLEPFHEFECTGIDNEYVIDVDITEEVKKTFSEYKVSKLRDPEGNLFDFYEDRFYRDPTEEEKNKIGVALGTGISSGTLYASKDWGDGNGYRAKVHYIPDGWEKVRIPHDSLEGFIEDYYGYKSVKQGDNPDIKEVHKFGYCTLNENGGVDKVIRRTNPNSKWDWYQIGGRFAGFFPLRKEARVNYMTSNPNFSWWWSDRDREKVVGNVDSAYKKDIDFQTIRGAAKIKAERTWDFIHSKIDYNCEYLTWKQIREIGEKESLEIDEMRSRYHNQEIVKRWEEVKRVLRNDESIDDDLKDILIWKNFDDFVQSREDYITTKVRDSVITFAILKDGVWYERGSMGWWGVVSGEDYDWSKIWNQIFETIPEDAKLTIVDCHI